MHGYSLFWLPISRSVRRRQLLNGRMGEGQSFRLLDISTAQCVVHHLLIVRLDEASPSDEQTPHFRVNARRAERKPHHNKGKINEVLGRTFI